MAIALGAVALAHGDDKPTAPLAMPVDSVLSTATLVGHVAPATQLTMTIALTPANRKAFESYVASLSDHNSVNYRKFLTPAQIGAKFGASTSTVNSTVAYLKKQGMKISLVADNHLAIMFTGTAAQAETAFATRLNNYRGPSVFKNGTQQDFYFYQTPPKLPSSIASKTVVVSGLQNYYLPKKRSTLVPSQTRVLYGAASIYDATGLNHKGEGINIGISNFDGIQLLNLPPFYSTFGLPAPSGGVGSNVTKVGLDPEQFSPSGEGDLDVQMVLAIAPKCHLFIYTQNDILGNLVLQGQDNRADIITESYGFNTSEGTRSSIAAYHDEHLAISAQGITFLSASGDHGTDLGGFDYPDFDPEIISVGGSVATVDGAGNRTTEDGWVGSGSGWSTFDIDFNHRPSWQTGNGIPSLPDKRIFPDLAIHAHGANKTFEQSTLESDFGYFMFIEGTETVSSGTSASSPNFAGQLGLILQELTLSGGLEVDPASGRPRLGALQKTHIYPKWNGRPDIFFDTTTGDTGLLPDNSEAVGKVGWDFVTGFGVPNDQGMLDDLLSEFVPPLTDEAVSAAIFSTASPNLTYGTNPEGGPDALLSADGVTYSVQSVKQTAVGQVAASTIDFNLQGTTSQRTSANLTVALTSPKLTTGYVYVKNVLTSRTGRPVYDLLRTITGNGTSTAFTTSLSLTKYVSSSNQVEVLVRGMKPTRLGSTVFRLVVDQAVVKERVRVN